MALIARDAEKTLDACLSSIRPYVEQIVVGVDVLTTDKTARVAKRYADKVFPVQVSDWHECPQHGRVMAQHFANARNASFSYLNPDLAFHCWLDSDDFLEGAENLKKQCDTLLQHGQAQDSIGVWWPYEYAYNKRADGSRAPNTLFHRERLLRTKLNGEPIRWKWEHRVHEVVTPDKPAKWIRGDDIRVVHQDGAHKSENSAARNLLLLEIEYEDNPNDSRTVFYCGNQYFAMGNWEAAVYWYGKLRELAQVNPYEHWQANLYACKAFQKMGMPSEALDAALACLEVRPEHPEPYFAMAEVYSMTGEWDKAVYWTKLGRGESRPVEPPFFVFKNPLDYAYNQHLPMAEALDRQGHITEARMELQQALAAMPNGDLQQHVQRLGKLETDMNDASAFAQVASKLPLEAREVLYEALPYDVRQFGRTRDVVMPGILSRRGKGTQPRIVFWCGRAYEEWGPPSIDLTGIGGSETAVIEIARRFGADGWRVDVFNEAGRYEGEYDGVGYWGLDRLRADEKADVFVSWRDASVHGLPIQAERKLLWCHDLNYGPGVAEDMRKWDQVLGVSGWHAEMLGDYYRLGGDRVSFVPNGINLERFAEDVEKVPFRCVWGSSADRGLNTLLDLWPKVLESEPAAELHIAYGWQTMDRMIQMGRADLADFKSMIMRKVGSTPKVVWRDRLPQNELAKLYQESWLWLYPTTFLEVSCITAMEAMAGGAVPVTSRAGALPETIGDAGMLVAGLTHTPQWREFYASVVRGALLDVNVRKPLEYAARKRARSLSWDESYQRWLEVVGAKKQEEVAA